MHHNLNSFNKYLLGMSLNNHLQSSCFGNINKITSPFVTFESDLNKEIIVQFHILKGRFNTTLHLFKRRAKGKRYCPSVFLCSWKMQRAREESSEREVPPRPERPTLAMITNSISCGNWARKGTMRSNGNWARKGTMRSNRTSSRLNQSTVYLGIHFTKSATLAT